MRFAITYLIVLVVIIASAALLSATRDRSVERRDFGTLGYEMTRAEFLNLPGGLKKSYVVWVLDRITLTNECVSIWKDDPRVLTGWTATLIRRNEELLSEPAMNAVLGALATACHPPPDIPAQR